MRSMKTLLIFMFLQRLKIGGFRGIFAELRGRFRVVTIFRELLVEIK